MLPCGPPPNSDGTELTTADKKGLMKASMFQKYGIAYQNIHNTRPQTLSYGLNDSPVGLLAWIVEKFRDWSDCGGNVQSVFTNDQILTNVMIYWLTNSIGSSVRLYYESQNVMPNTSQELRDLASQYISQPTACAQFPYDLYYGPKAWLMRTMNVQKYTLFESGGQFAAMEKPKVYVREGCEGFLFERVC